jgi:hypothetical protein
MQAESVQIDAYEDYLRKKAPPLNFHMMEIQHIFLKEKKDATGKIVSRQKEVEEMLSKLTSGKMSETEIERFIVEKTEEPALQATAGNDLPICLNCAGNRKEELVAVIQKTNLNQFIQVEKPGVGIWIARKIQEKTVSESNLKNYFINYYTKRNQIVQKYYATIKDENMRQTVFDKLLLKEKKVLTVADETTNNYLKTEKKRSPLEDRMEELKKKINFKMENTISFHGEKKITSSDIKDETLIYSIGDKTFTYNDLKKRFPPETFEVSEQLKYMGKLIEYDVLLHDNEFKRMVDTDFYTQVLNARKTRALADTYMYVQHKENVTNNEANSKSPLDELEKKYKLNILSSKL